MRPGTEAGKQPNRSWIEYLGAWNMINNTAKPATSYIVIISLATN